MYDPAPKRFIARVLEAGRQERGCGTSSKRCNLF